MSEANDPVDDGGQIHESPADPDDTPPADDTPRASVRDVAIAFGLSLVLTFGLDMAAFAVPFIRANLLALVAAVFLYVPVVVLPRSGPGLEHYGLTLARAGRGVLWGLAMGALTFVFFLPGYHIWATRFLDQHLDPDAGAYQHVSDRYYGEPGDIRDERVYLYQRNDLVRVQWSPPPGPWEIEISTDARIIPAMTGTYGVLAEDASTWTVHGESAHPVSLAFTTRGGSDLRLRVAVAGQALPPEAYALGGTGERPNPEGSLFRRRTFEDDHVSLALNARWLLYAVLVQLLMVALPEEFFYRGFLQRRLDEARGHRRFRIIGPLFLTPSILIVSAGFALGHFVIGWFPTRLAVFFPSLLFGWLRDRTDGIAAGVTYHALCNLMVMAVSVHYLY